MSVSRRAAGSVLFVVLGGLLAGMVLIAPARVVHAANPDTFTLTVDDRGPFAFDGQDFPGTFTWDPTLGCTSATCDIFELIVDVPDDFWDTRYGGARVRIDWESMDNDFDMYAYCADAEGCGPIDEEGNREQEEGDQVASSTGTMGTTNYEDMTILYADGTYEIHVVPFLLLTDEPSEQDPPEDAPGTADADGFVELNVADSYPQNPERGNPGGVEFAPQTVIDFQRTEGEPLNWNVDGDEHWDSGPMGTSTQQSFIHRSTDDGDSWHIVSPIQLRPNAPPGGGDTDVVTDDQGNVYFSDLEGLVQIDASVSNDKGNTWRKNPAAPVVSITGATIDDRQWMAIDHGLTDGPEDNTVFLQYRQIPLGSFILSTPGSTATPGSSADEAVLEDPIGGVVYEDTTPDDLGADAPGAPCGQLQFKDPPDDGGDDNRFLYLPCGQGDHVILTMGHVAPSQRTDIVYVSIPGPSSPGGVVGDIFPLVAIDDVGSVYLVWADEVTHDVYYTYADDLPDVYAALTDEDEENDAVKPTWSDVRQVNGGPETASNVFPWARAAGDGNLLVGWYGSAAMDSHGVPIDSDDMTSWYDDPEGADDHEWFGYVSVIQNANSAEPDDVVYNQAPFTHKPMHFGQICNEGTFCLVSDGDRTMADYMALFPDAEDGRARIVFNDTTSQHHGAHLFEAEQIAGPTLHGAAIDEPQPGNPQTDPAEDAQWPHYSLEGEGENHPQFDFLNLELSQPDDAHLRVEMTLADLAALDPPEGEATSLWITRFLALSDGDFGDLAYRIFYVGMESDGGDPSFFAGSGEASQAAAPGADCFTTTAGNCKFVFYPAEVEATGTVNGNVITIDVPLQGGFGEDRPLLAGTLYSVVAFSGGRGGEPSTPDLYADVDATRSFDYVLATGPDTPPPAPPSDPPAPATPTASPGRAPLPNTSAGDVTLHVAIAFTIIMGASLTAFVLVRRRSEETESRT